MKLGNHYTGELYDALNGVVEINYIRDNWVDGSIIEEGELKGMRIQMKVFHQPSTYGVDNGRISKISIWDEMERQEKQDFHAACLYSHSRGWALGDRQPDPHAKAFIDRLNEKLALTAGPPI